MVKKSRPRRVRGRVQARDVLAFRFLWLRLAREGRVASATGEGFLMKRDPVIDALGNVNILSRLCGNLRVLFLKCHRWETPIRVVVRALLS